MNGPWDSPLSEPMPERPAPAGMARALLLNLRAGLRVARFKPAGRRQFVVTGQQAMVSLGIAALLIFAYSMARWQHFALLGYAFDSGWFSMLGASCLLLFVTAYAVSVLAHDPQGINGFAVVVISSLLVPISVLLAIGAGMTPLAAYIYRADAPSWIHGAPYIAFVVTAVWCLSTLARSLRITYRLKGMRPALLGLSLIGVFFVPSIFDWSKPEEAATADIEDDEDESSIPYDLDIESTFYAQPDLVDRAAAAMAAGRPGVIDLYFVGFGSYAFQNVFRSEVEKVTALFAERFDTGGRSASLINHGDTVAEVPLASVSNLKRLLPQIAGRMNKDEDILFLFLTSHGSPGEISVEFTPLMLNNLHADELDRMLDDAGIKWRVLVISACYSGSFIEPLKDDNSLIITASDGDHTSFGCSNENEFTYFGDAYFNQALRRKRSFIGAFEQARKTIAAREAAEDLTPSEPQIHVGAAIRERLKEFEARLNSASSTNRSAGG